MYSVRQLLSYSAKEKIVYLRKAGRFTPGLAWKWANALYRKAAPDCVLTNQVLISQDCQDLALLSKGRTCTVAVIVMHSHTAPWWWRRGHCLLQQPTCVHC